jgi:hypothetical protein
MSNRYARILASGCAAVLVAALGVTAALAAGTWTIQPGDGIQAKAMTDRVTITDTTTGTLLKCRSSTASGTLKSGSGLPAPTPAPCPPSASVSASARAAAPHSFRSPVACPGT